MKKYGVFVMDRNGTWYHPAQLNRATLEEAKNVCEKMLQNGVLPVPGWRNVMIVSIEIEGSPVPVVQTLPAVVWRPNV